MGEEGVGGQAVSKTQKHLNEYVIIKKLETVIDSLFNCDWFKSEEKRDVALHNLLNFQEAFYKYVASVNRSAVASKGAL